MLRPAAKTLKSIGGLYEIEGSSRDPLPETRRGIRETRAKSMADVLHHWMLVSRQKVQDGETDPALRVGPLQLPVCGLIAEW